MSYWKGCEGGIQVLCWPLPYSDLPRWGLAITDICCFLTLTKFLDQNVRCAQSRVSGQSATR